ncbi:hypothetical protein Slin15195_G044860 [Septoria linicola]|uniref:Zn(2)-C6 fungal-type domain-containing protein n=1 Tax=Septoria linicola TaxID=215465 RepID=A0A9Q9EIL2_9PEZI|nr:hypothetical protein Slin14017_G048380 [Septoria linicola]USW51167.1 hypothetical protein Slin15195_G044860 [Septoria linicola]
MAYAATQAEPLRPFPHHHERHLSHASERLPYPTPRPEVELPRPLEPRPPQQSYSEAPRDQRRLDAYRSPAASHTGFRPHSQSLPRLHDILTSAAPSVPSPPSYSSSWGANGAPGPHVSQHNVEPRYGHHGHQSQAAHHPQEHPSYYPHSGRRLELPILETSPVSRHDSHIGPTSPYDARADSRGYDTAHRERSRQASIHSYPHNGAPSPYMTAGPEEHHYRIPAGAVARPSSDNYGPAGPECSKKYLGIRELPGEGTFHLYEGGFRIPTHVDGEQVNPAWGLTKANKPRKRLAMACLDCREKKIKCEPGASSCLQCEKAKRPCRKAPAHQSQGESSPGATWPHRTGSPLTKSASSFIPQNGHGTEHETSHKRRTLDEQSPRGGPSKKHRSSSPAYRLNGNTAPGANMLHQYTSPMQPRSPGRGLSPEDDPYAACPEATLQVLEHYFQDVNNATYCIYPRHHFMHWLRGCSDKYQNEKLLLYSMLAIGSLFAEDAHAAFGQQCAQIAADSLRTKQGRYEMPVIQSRLLLGLYHFAKGESTTGWDYIGAGIDAALYLRYNTEQGCAANDTAGRPRSDFNLSSEQLIECKRRTLWSAFLMDRFCGGTSTLINPQDIFLRLPALDDSFERGLRSEAPYCDNGIIDPMKAAITPSSPMSPMAWLCLMGAIWGDVVNFIYRATHRSPLTYREEYDKFYEQTSAALRNWSSRLPEQLQFSKLNVERSIKGCYAGPYISMHILYHLSWVKMNRFVRHALVPQSITRNICATHRHSHELLQVMSTLRAAKWDIAEKDGHIASFSFTTPFAGYAILAAIDVVGAGGLDTHLKATLDLISCGLESLRELARYWSTARDQDKACEKRYYQIHNVLKHPFTARSGCWLGREWGVTSSLEQEFTAEDDCIYGADDRIYFDALRDDPPHGRAPSAGHRTA